MSWVGTAELWSKGMIHVVTRLYCIILHWTIDYWPTTALPAGKPFVGLLVCPHAERGINLPETRI